MLDGSEETPKRSVSRRDWIYWILQSTATLSIASKLKAEQGHSGLQFLTPEQNETLIALGERIVPGSAAASCSRVIDLIMTVESEKVREELVHALAEFDNQARRHYRKPFCDLTSEQQDALLTSAVTEKSFQFGVVKEWVADAYWSSEKGLRELGWTGRMAWQSFPGCGNPSAHN